MFKNLQISLSLYISKYKKFLDMKTNLTLTNYKLLKKLKTKINLDVSSHINMILSGPL